MELNKQHKVLLGVVALGAGAVIIDRSVFSGGFTQPKSAQADQPVAIEAQSHQKAAALALAASHPLVQRVGRANKVLPAGEREVAAAFRAPPGWFASAGASPASQSHSQTSDPAAVPLRVSSVMTRPVVAAVINGHMLRADQDYMFGVTASGTWELLRHEDVLTRRRNDPDSLRTVRLLSVEPRTTSTKGGAVVRVNGSDQHELLIDASEND